MTSGRPGWRYSAGARQGEHPGAGHLVQLLAVLGSALPPGRGAAPAPAPLPPSAARAASHQPCHPTPPLG